MAHLNANLPPTVGRFSLRNLELRLIDVSFGSRYKQAPKASQKAHTNVAGSGLFKDVRFVGRLFAHVTFSADNFSLFSLFRSNKVLWRHCSKATSFKYLLFFFVLLFLQQADQELTTQYWPAYRTRTSTATSKNIRASSPIWTRDAKVRQRCQKPIGHTQHALMFPLKHSSHATETRMALLRHRWTAGDVPLPQRHAVFASGVRVRLVV